VLVDGDRLTFEGLGEAEEDGEARGIRGGRMAPRPVVRGRAEGPLVGGNLTVLTTLVGTPYLPDLAGHVVFFEDVNEPLYRIDRLLTQLRLAGALDDVAGVVFGQCSSCPGEGEADVEWLLRDHLGPLGRPAWSGAPIGHVSPVYTLPVGIPVRTDATYGILELLEPAVS
jgi:muramoyltetrapeptide carboxypeptidase